MSNDSLMPVAAPDSSAADPVHVTIEDQPVQVTIDDQPIQVFATVGDPVHAHVTECVPIDIASCVPIDIASLPEPVHCHVTEMVSPLYSAPYMQEVTPQLSSLSISCNSAGNNVLVAAVANQVVRVYRMFMVVAASDTMYFRDGAAGSAITGTMTMTQGGSIVFDFDGEPWFITSSGNAFVLNMTAGVQVSGRIYFTQG